MSEENARGRQAKRPTEIPASGWKDVGLRVFNQISRDRVTLLSAGVTYYALLSIFPTLALLVAIYGFLADPATIVSNAKSLTSFLPTGTVDIFLNQMKDLAGQQTEALSISALVSAAVALWSAHNGILALFEALNAAYNETEKRSLIRLNAIGFVFTLATLLAAIVIIFAVGAVPVILGYLGIGSMGNTITLIGRWPILAILSIGGAAILYRFGPSRAAARIEWLSLGSVFAGIAWCVLTIGYSIYLQNFADYQATYGTLGALIGFMVWIWFSVVILLVGAEINGELEHQTRHDTTTGRPKPMGQRGAYVADTLGAVAKK